MEENHPFFIVSDRFALAAVPIPHSASGGCGCNQRICGRVCPVLSRYQTETPGRNSWQKLLAETPRRNSWQKLLAETPGLCDRNPEARCTCPALDLNHPF